MELLYVLILTIIIEGIVMLIMTRSKKWVYYNLLCNMLTNPLLNLSLFAMSLTLGKNAYYITLVIGEIIVLFGEAWLYNLMTSEKFKVCFIRSLVTNCCSLLIGMLRW